MHHLDVYLAKLLFHVDLDTILLGAPYEYSGTLQDILKETELLEKQLEDKRIQFKMFVKKILEGPITQKKDEIERDFFEMKKEFLQLGDQTREAYAVIIHKFLDGYTREQISKIFEKTTKISNSNLEIETEVFLKELFDFFNPTSNANQENVIEHKEQIQTTEMLENTLSEKRKELEMFVQGILNDPITQSDDAILEQFQKMRLDLLEQGDRITTACESILNSDKCSEEERKLWEILSEKNEKIIERANVLSKELHRFVKYKSKLTREEIVEAVQQNNKTLMQKKKDLETFVDRIINSTNRESINKDDMLQELERLRTEFISEGKKTRKSYWTLIYSRYFTKQEHKDYETRILEISKASLLYQSWKYHYNIITFFGNTHKNYTRPSIEDTKIDGEELLLEKLSSITKSYMKWKDYFNPCKDIVTQLRKMEESLQPIRIQMIQEMQSLLKEVNKIPSSKRLIKTMIQTQIESWIQNVQEETIIGFIEKELKGQKHDNTHHEINIIPQHTKPETKQILYAQAHGEPTSHVLPPTAFAPYIAAFANKLSSLAFPPTPTEPWHANTTQKQNTKTPQTHTKRAHAPPSPFLSILCARVAHIAVVAESHDTLAALRFALEITPTSPLVARALAPAPSAALEHPAINALRACFCDASLRQLHSFARPPRPPRLPPSTKTTDDETSGNLVSI